MINLVDSTEADVPFVMELEKHPANSPYIGQWSEAQHVQAIQNEENRHLIISYDGNSVGYVILAGVTGVNRSMEITRIVVSDKGKGIGYLTLEELKRLAFVDLKFHRLWLDVREKNTRAKALYEKCGFKVEGMLRESVRVNNRFESVYVLSILKKEFDQMKPGK